MGSLSRIPPGADDLYFPHLSTTSTTWPRRRPSTTSRASSSPTPWDTIEARIKSDNGELTTPEPHITKSGGGSGNQSAKICLSFFVNGSALRAGVCLSDRHVRHVMTKNDRQTVFGSGPTPATPTTFSHAAPPRLITAQCRDGLPFQSARRLTCVPRLTVRSEVTTPHPPRLRPQRAGLTGLSVIAVVVSRRHRQ
mgnify:CR=1 FL=1